ncbi:MAG: cyclic pyranopterin monophosphate synthase MoaC [Allosphingosinicella sp.]
MSRLSHLDAQGRARMVDVSDKAPTQRVATAAGQLRCQAETLAMVRAGTTPKGSVVQTAEIAGVMAAKRTAELIPLCHPLPLTKVAVTIETDERLPGFRVSSEVRTQGVTGVEMEALTAVSVACLTLFDMLKAVDRTMTIDGVHVVTKTGGKSGDWPQIAAQGPDE